MRLPCSWAAESRAPDLKTWEIQERPEKFRGSRRLAVASVSSPSVRGAMATHTQDPSPRRPRVLAAASGSVVAIKFESLCRGLAEWADVRAVAIVASLHFIDRASFPTPSLSSPTTTSGPPGARSATRSSTSSCASGLTPWSSPLSPPTRWSRSPAGCATTS